MTDKEIAESYLGAKNRKTQITVLADLNVVSKNAMLSKLRKLGFDVPRPKVPKNDKLMGHYKRGCTDKEIAQTAGVTIYTVKYWREKYELPGNVGRKQHGKAKKNSPAHQGNTPDALSPAADGACLQDQ